MTRARRAVLIYVALVGFGLGPLFVALAAGGIANALGCRLNEAAAHPCQLGPFDIGESLYGFGMMGWLSIATLPLAGLAMAGFTLYLLIRRLRQPR